MTLKRLKVKGKKQRGILKVAMKRLRKERKEMMRNVFSSLKALLLLLPVPDE